MSTFAATFREVVTPDLRRLCHAQGLFVALGLTTFADACAEVMHHAVQRGASHLPSRLLDELDDWIATTILKATDEFTPSIREHKAIADRVAADIARCEATWAMT